MKYIIIWLLALLLLGFPVFISKADNDIPETPVKKEWTKGDTLLLINQKALEYGVSRQIMASVIKCESSFNTEAIGDNGTSFGLSQIHLPAHPTITKEQALDPEFAIDFMAKEMSKGRAWKWSCYRHL